MTSILTKEMEQDILNKITESFTDCKNPEFKDRLNIYSNHYEKQKNNNYFHNCISFLDGFYVERYTIDKLQNLISKTDYINYKYSNLSYFIENELIDLQDNKQNNNKLLTSKFLINNFYNSFVYNKVFLDKIYDNGGYFGGTNLYYGSKFAYSYRELNVGKDETKNASFILNLKLLQKEYEIKNKYLQLLNYSEVKLFNNYEELLILFKTEIKKRAELTSKKLHSTHTLNYMKIFDKSYMDIHKISIDTMLIYSKIILEISELHDAQDYKKLKEDIENIEIIEYYIGIGLWFYSNGYIVIYTLSHILSFDKSEFNFELTNNTEFFTPFLNQTQHKNYSKLIDCYNKVKNKTFAPIYTLYVVKNFNKIKKSLFLQNSYIKTGIHTIINDVNKIEKIILQDEIKENKKKRKNKKKSNKNDTIIDIELINNNDIIETENTIDITDYKSNSSSDDEIEIEHELQKIIQKNITENEENKYTIVSKKTHFNISFNYYDHFESKSYIRFLIEDCYRTNEKFNEFMSNYTDVRVKRDIHYDMNGLEKSLHFNLVFYNKDFNEKTPTYHAYIYNNSISSMTRLECIF